MWLSDFVLPQPVSVPSPLEMDTSSSPAVYTGSPPSEPAIGVSSSEPSAIGSPLAKLHIWSEDGNEDLLDELLASCEPFTPHIINIKAGEDVMSKIIAFCQQVPDYAVCIISAIGKLSEITLSSQPPSNSKITYQGEFAILTLSGSFRPTSTEGSDRTHAFNITFAGPDATVECGRVAGRLIAANSVRIIVGSFFPNFEKLIEQNTE